MPETTGVEEALTEEKALKVSRALKGTFPFVRPKSGRRDGN
jgi:hypothetical protein